MKIILLDGEMKGVNVGGEAKEIIIIRRWHCGEYPSKGYELAYEYKLRCIVNIGKPIAYYNICMPQISLEKRQAGSLGGLGQLAYQGAMPQLADQLSQRQAGIFQALGF